MFISYATGGIAEVLASEFLLKELRLRLADRTEGNKDCVFFAPRTIENGGDLDDRVAGALRTSAILIPLWTTRYWLSDWCRCEWDTFVNRERALGLRGRPNNTPGLIYPLLVEEDAHDHPAAENTLVTRDLQKFNTLGRTSTRAQKQAWVEQVELIAVDLKRWLRAAPPVQDWPIAPMPRIGHVGPNPRSTS